MEQKKIRYFKEFTDEGFEENQSATHQLNNYIEQTNDEFIGSQYQVVRYEQANQERTYILAEFFKHRPLTLAYQTESIEDYNDLMCKLENQGYTWISGQKPTNTDYCLQGRDVVYLLDCGRLSLYVLTDEFDQKYPNIELINFKKGDVLYSWKN